MTLFLFGHSTFSTINKTRRDGMYEGGKGAGAVAAGSVILPNTGGSRALTAIAVTSIAVGVIIVVTTVARFVASKAR